MSAPQASAPAFDPGVPDKADFRWRSLRYFNAYRLTLASFFLVATFLYRGSYALGTQDFPFFIWTCVAYWLAAILFLVLQEKFRLEIPLFLTITVLVDILALTLLAYASGGHRSGLAFMMLVSLAGAALVGEGRMVLFYAAVASIALLLEQTWRVLNLSGEAAEFSQIGFTSTGFFAIALLMRFLAQRVMENERLARQRGIALARQVRINELVIRDMQDGVLVVMATGRVRQRNPQAEKLLGVAPEAGADLSQYSSDLAQRFAAGGQALAGSSHAFHGNGRTILARFVSAGEGDDFIIYLEDQDRIQRLAEQVKLAALGRLTAGIAHEIRNPLSAIGHAAELLREGAETGTEARLTRIIGDNVRRMDTMVREVLEMGRRDRMHPEAIPLASFLRGFAEEFCAREGISPSVMQISVRGDATLEFDRAHLNQVLWNLLRNALRYCRGKTGSLSLSSPSDGSGSCELHLRDDGPGIAPELRAQVFEPFFTTDSKGTGLGLYIARELCEANGASLDLADYGPDDPGAHFILRGRSEAP
ncbi:MAG: ATP-binding protein [Rhodocyclaceae bacterium]|nr:ATP-binding protein [Rhodocyclaceae bacterium]